MKIFVAEIAVLAMLVLGARLGSSTLLTNNCGTTRHPSRIRRVVGGRDADRFGNPWMAMVLYDDKFCGGSLITRLFVLTSADCASWRPKQVILGEYDTNCTSVDCTSIRQVMDIDERIIHDQFDLENYKRNDIALLRLAKKVSISDYVRPICLFVDRQVGRGVQYFTATGWGATNQNERSTILQKVTLSRFNRKYCERIFKENMVASLLCVGGPRKDTCDGDIGGPLSVKLRIDGEGKWNSKSRTFLIGMTSYGTYSCSGIGAYTNVEHHVDWIVQSINRSNELASQTPKIAKDLIS
ncbi:CLIP domain-containing serine protease 2 [Drosophila simulans]|nr:CLIP domain-containing serine protease 2 [Drosophila simulans]EDX16063.1 GD12740 [Drosophila simulans]